MTDGRGGTITGMSAVPPLDQPLDPEVAALLRRDPAGLVAAVVQQHDTGEVLMVGLDGRRGAAPHPDHRPGHVLVAQPRASTGSRARRRATGSGCATSRLDCDGDALLVLVDQEGAGLPHRRAQLLPPRPLPAVAGRAAREVRRHHARRREEFAALDRRSCR